MADLLTSLLTGVGLLIAATLGALLLTYLAYAGGQMFMLLIEHLSGRVGSAFLRLEDSVEERTRRRQVEDEVWANVRPPVGTARIDRQFVQAAKATQCITASLKVTKNAMEICCDGQRFAAQAQGARDMAEVEWDPLCVRLRQRVLSSIDVALDHLQRYPGFAGERQVMKQTIALRALRQICADCELLRYSVSDVPALCTPAASMSQKPKGQGKGT